MTQTMQQERAGYALEKVLALESKLSAAEKKEFRSYAADLPAMIHMNGLGQAAAFFKSKGKVHEILYDLLSTWMTKPLQPYNGCTDLLDGVTSKTMHDYRLAQAEAQMLMDWVKKFAKAYIPAEDEKTQKTAPGGNS